MLHDNCCINDGTIPSYRALHVSFVVYIVLYNHLYNQSVLEVDNEGQVKKKTKK